MDLKKGGKFSKNLMLRDGKGTMQRGAFLRKRFRTVLSTCQNILQDQTEVQTMRDQWWAGPHLSWDCLDGHILRPLFNV